MKVLIVNSIIYTSETKNVKKVNTIKDTMIYDLCLGFKSIGADVTLAACSDFKPSVDEDYPFNIEWFDAKCKGIFPVHALPFCPRLIPYVRRNKFDLIISSEVFSLNSLMLVLTSPKNLIVWHELAKHNRIFKGLASRVWYGVIARLLFRNTLIAPRSIEAKNFISQFCKNVSDTIIDHGVNLEKFTASSEKEKQFAISSQLIARKRIDKAIDAFAEFVKEYDSEYKLFIMGEGEEEQALKNHTEELGVADKVIFTGKLAHAQLIEILARSRAMLVYTEKDNSMVSIVESIAVGTPVITTSVPYNSSYIRASRLGIVDDCWDSKALLEIISSEEYIKNCLAYRDRLSTASKAKIFLSLKS